MADVKDFIQRHTKLKVSETVYVKDGVYAVKTMVEGKPRYFLCDFKKNDCMIITKDVYRNYGTRLNELSAEKLNSYALTANLDSIKKSLESIGHILKGDLPSAKALMKKSLNRQDFIDRAVVQTHHKEVKMDKEKRMAEKYMERFSSAINEEFGLTEGTWSYPEGTEGYAEVKRILSQPLPAASAGQELYHILGDDELYDEIDRIEQENPNQDVREIFCRRLCEIIEDSDDHHGKEMYRLCMQWRDKMGYDRMHTPDESKSFEDSIIESTNNTPNAVNFIRARPTMLFTIAGVNFYEHPTEGDESPIVAIVDGNLCRTDFYDRPDKYEALDFIDETRKKLAQKNESHNLTAAETRRKNLGLKSHDDRMKEAKARAKKKGTKPAPKGLSMDDRKQAMLKRKKKDG